MTDELLRPTAPVGLTSGFGQKPGNQSFGQPQKQAPAKEPEAADSVQLLAPERVARELLRERILAHTRNGLGLDLRAGHEFAEVRAAEGPAAFLGRLLSAQNQLAANRAAAWSGRRLRECLDRALRSGVQEALDMLIADGRGSRAAEQFVAAVVREYEHRLAGWADEPELPG